MYPSRAALRPRSRLIPLLRKPRRSGLSMLGALGGGAELCALFLATVWALGLSAVPLAHAVQHASAEGLGHCHGTVCHDLPRHQGPAVDEAPAGMGELAASHGLAVAAVPVAFVFVAPTLGLAPLVESLPTSRRALSAPSLDHWARGPPAPTSTPA